MERRLRITKIVAWTIIGLWLTRGLLFRLIGIDFATIEIARNFRSIWLILIPLSIALLVFTSWKNSKFSSRRLLTLVLTIAFSFAMILILNFFSSFCEWNFSDALYKNRNTDIIVRYHTLDCGATDGSPTNNLVTTYNIGAYLIKYDEIDREELNNIEWVKQ